MKRPFHDDEVHRLHELLKRRIDMAAKSVAEALRVARAAAGRGNTAFGRRCPVGRADGQPSPPCHHPLTRGQRRGTGVVAWLEAKVLWPKAGSRGEDVLALAVVRPSPHGAADKLPQVPAVPSPGEQGWRVRGLAARCRQ